jgi:uncharacterized membrane protein
MRAGNPTWTWGVTVVIFLVIAWLSSPRAFVYPEDEAAPTGAALRYAQADGFDEVHQIVMGRCSMCHAAEPSWAGMLWPPKGVMLETPGQVAAQARDIYMQSGASHAMPPGNLSYMEPAERARIVAWFRGAG